MLKKYTVEQYAEVLSLYQEEKTFYRISKLTGINKGTVRDWCKRNIKPISVWTQDDFDAWNARRDTPERSANASLSKIGAKNPMWKGNDADDDSARGRARRKFKAPQGTERHHVDGNPRNNDPNNVVFLTRRQHMIVDGRLKNLKQFRVQHSKPGK